MAFDQVCSVSSPFIRRSHINSNKMVKGACQGSQQSSNKGRPHLLPLGCANLSVQLSPSPLLRVSALSPLVAKGISCYRNGGWQLWGKSGNCKMDQLLDKAPAQEAVAAPGCQELAVLLTEPGSSLQRDFANCGAKSLFPQHKW